MSLKGDLGTVGLTTILQLLETDGKSGLLQITTKEKIAGLFLKDGAIAYATCSQSDSRLGYLLRSSGVITDEELETHLALSRETDQALGKILVDKNVITDETLSEFIHKQAENIIYDIFFWKEGIYEYKDIEIDSDRILLKQIKIMNVLLEASRRINEMQDMKELIPDDTLIFEQSVNIKHMEDALNEQESSALALVDGKCSVREVIEKSGLDEYSGFSVLNSLILSGCIQPNEESTPQEPVEVDLEQQESPTLENLQLVSDGDSEETEETVPEKPDLPGDTKVDVPAEDLKVEERQESDKVIADVEENPPIENEKEKPDSFFRNAMALIRKEKRFVVVGASIICLFLIVESLILVFGPKYLEDKRMETEYQSLLIQAENTKKLEEREKILMNFLKSNRNSNHSRDIEKKIKEIRKHIIERDYKLTVRKADKLSENENYAEVRTVYHQHLEQYPKTVYADEIKKKLAEVNSLADAEDYENLKDIAPKEYEMRITAYDTYLINHPEGKYKEEVASLNSSAIKGYCKFLTDETKAGKNISINTLILEKHKKQMLSMSTDLMLPDERLKVKELFMKGNQELKKGRYDVAVKHYKQSLALVKDSQLADFPAYKTYENKISSALNDERLRCYRDGLAQFKTKCYSVQEYEKIALDHGYVKDKGKWYSPDDYETLMISRGFYKYEEEYLNQDRFEKEVIVPVLIKKCKLEDWQKIHSIDLKLTKSNDVERVYKIMGVAAADLEDYRVVVKMSIDATFNIKDDYWLFFNPKKDSSLKQYE